MSNRATNAQLYEAARDIVERVRQGDQVAMAHMAMVRVNAEKGHPAAIRSKKVLERYIANNPPESRINGEVTVSDITQQNNGQLALWGVKSLENPDDQATMVLQVVPVLSTWQAIMAIVHAPVELASAMYNKLGPEKGQAFAAGCNYKRRHAIAKATKEGMACYKLGMIFGLANIIRCVGEDKMPIAEFCPVTAWELGE